MRRSAPCSARGAIFYDCGVDEGHLNRTIHRPVDLAQVGKKRGAATSPSPGARID
jgi:hypothetical protein